MRNECSYNLLLTQRPKTNLGETLGKNFLNRLVEHAQELAKSVTEMSSKIQVSKNNNETINDSLHDNRWREAIDEKLSNLDSHQTWTYISLPIGQKIISSKRVFKVKYHPNNLIERYKRYLVTQSFF